LQGNVVVSDNDKTQSFLALNANTRVLHYKIIKTIGSGGMGEVFLALDTKLNRKIALKFLLPHLCQDEECRARFRREAQATAGLEHPNIASIYEVSDYNGRPFYSMQVIEGQSLRNVIKGKDLKIDLIFEIAIQMCEGLQAAHDMGIIHRDIKPSNILLDSHGRVRIVDFGLAFIHGSKNLTKTGSTFGTIGYMSPEQVQGIEIDHRSDLFSLGVVFFELITKQNPFKRDNEAATLRAVGEDIPYPLVHYRSDIPTGLQGIIERVLEKHVETRYQSAADLASDIKRISINRSKSTSITKQQHSIAVLPFVDMSSENDQEYFCDGIAEELINALTKIGGLKVAARTSAFQYKQHDRSISVIGRELSVTTVLEGSVRKAGNRLRITAQLISVKDCFHLWSGKFDRKMDDIFAIQDEISMAVVDKLKVKLLGEEKATLVKRYTKDQNAYNQYLKGRYFWNRRYEGGLQKGMKCFQQAIDNDPMYALAYSGLADCYSLLGLFSYLRPKDAYFQARNAAEKALEIDNTIGEAHASMAFICLYYDWNWVMAEKEFKRAISLSPKYATAHEWYGMYLCIRGQFSKAIDEMKLAQELTPLEPIISSMAGLTYLFARRYQEAMELFQKTIEVDHNFPTVYFLRGQAYVSKMMWYEAISDFKMFVTFSAGNALALGFLGGAYALSGNMYEASKILDQLDELSKGRYVSPFCKALIYAGLGKNEETFENLDKAYLERESFLVFLKYWPNFDPFLSDKHFGALLKKIGLE